MYLGLYTWNARTGFLDSMAERSGLEIVGYALSPLTWIKDRCASAWEHYVALIGVAEENTRLRAELRKAERQQVMSAEAEAELVRLRELFALEPIRQAPAVGARIIAQRFGSQAVLKTMTVNKGYFDGAVVGTPVISATGVVGKVFRAAPNASTVLLLTDPDCRLAVISQETRTPGVVCGMPGDTSTLEVRYVGQATGIRVGELLITSGIDGDFPKGIPVGRVTLVEPPHETLFRLVHAEPIVRLDHLEEVLLLMPPDSGPPLVAPEPVALPADSGEMSDPGGLNGSEGATQGQLPPTE